MACAFASGVGQVVRPAVRELGDARREIRRAARGSARDRSARQRLDERLSVVRAR